jgi:hypothetical protein
MTYTAPEQTTPLIEQESEAAQHDSFIRPITPFEEKRQEIIDRRETISAQSATRNELSNMFPNTPELGNYFNPRPSLGSRKTTLSSAQTPLPSDNFEFLKRPYEPEISRPFPSAPSAKSLKKKSSLGNFFLRKKSSIVSIATARENFDGQNALGIEMAPTTPLALTPTMSTETFPRFSQDTPSVRPTLSKQVSYNGLEKSTTTTSTIHSLETHTAPGIIQSGLSEIAEDDQFKRMLKMKASLPNLRSRRFYEKATDGSGGEDHFFIRTGDEYERYTHVVIPRAATSQAQAPKKDIRKAKSFTSLRLWATKDTQETTKPRKTSRFRREPKEGETISSRMISEPFPMRSRHNFASLAPESRDKEYARRWFIEEARARRYGLNKPDGEPWKDEDEEMEKKEKKRKGTGILRQKKKEEEAPPPFEMPRATPKVPERPNRQRWDSIFPRRAPPPKPKSTTHTPIDLGKYAKIPGKVIL